MEYKCETDRDAQDAGDVYAIQFTDDARYVDFRGNDFDGVAITMANQGGNTRGSAGVQVNDIQAMARELAGVSRWLRPMTGHQTKHEGDTHRHPRSLSPHP